MRAKKDAKTGKWYIRFRYTDWQGKRRETMKRGFDTKHDAEEWLRAFLSEQSADLNITFAALLHGCAKTRSVQSTISLI